MAMMNDDAIDVGTGDVFKDLGFADAQERRLRTELAIRLNDLRNFKLRRFSSERLLHFITQLDKDVEIIIRPKARDHAAGSVSILVAT
jgi:predicted XRE-type DNA-binding protein